MNARTPTKRAHVIAGLSEAQAVEPGAAPPSEGSPRGRAVAEHHRWWSSFDGSRSRDIYDGYVLM